MRRLSLFALLACLAGQPVLAEDAPPPTAPAAPAAPPALTPAEDAMTKQMQAFMDRSEKRIFDKIKALNGGLEVETKTFSYPAAEHLVKVTRGPVVEKAGWYVNISTKAAPPFVPEPKWNRYMEINIHPKSPLVGMLHATIYFAYFASGKMDSIMAGYQDYVPAVWNDEDIASLKAAVDAVYARNGVDIGRFRRQLCESAFGAKNHRDRLKASCAGTSLYDPPFMPVTEANFALATEAFDAFVDAYFRILEKRKDQPYTPADVRLQDAMRKRWLEDQLFADTMSMKVVPYEVWSLANQAPAIRY